MSAALTGTEWQALSTRFGLRMHDSSQPMIQSVLSEDLLDPVKCERYLDWLTQYIGAPSRRVTASMLAKRYAFLTIAPILYAMSMYNKGLKLSIGSCRIISPDYTGGDQGRSRFPDLALRDLQISKPAAGDREQWRNQVLQDIFAGHLSPIFLSLSKVGRVPMAILWENAAVRIAPLYEDGLEECRDSMTKQRIRDDFEYLSRTAPARLFGERRNPLSRFMGATKIDSSMEEAPSIRQTCCLYYEMAAEYCRKCPITSRP